MRGHRSVQGLLLIAALAACTSSAAHRATVPTASPSPSPAPAVLPSLLPPTPSSPTLPPAGPPTPSATGVAAQVVDVSFVDDHDGFALSKGEVNCIACPVELSATTDLGQSFHPLTSPGKADVVSSIAFADAQDGWAFGPDLRVTRDGGRSWTAVTGLPGPVRELEVGSDRVWAVVKHGSTPDGSDRQELWSSPRGSDAWARRAALPFEQRASLAVHGTTAWVGGGIFRKRTGVGQVLRATGGSVQTFDIPSGPTEYENLGAASDSILWAVATDVAGLGNEARQFLVSRDAGQTWTATTSAKDDFTSGYAGSVFPAPGSLTAALVNGGRMPSYLTTTAGHDRTAVFGDAAGFDSFAAFLTDRVAVGCYMGSFLASTDGGRTFVKHPVAAG